MTSLICECELTSWILNEQKRIEPRANPPDSSRKSIFCCSNLEKNCNEILYGDGTAVVLFYSRTVPYHLASIWCFSYSLWHLDFCIRRMRVWMGRGVKSQVSCTSSRFQTPPAPSIPSLSPSPSFNCRFPLRSTVLNHRFLVRGRYIGRYGLGEERTRDKSERFEY